MATELEIAQQQLDAVRAAILGILSGSGQSYTIAGRTLQKADLRELRFMEKDLLARINRATNGGVRVRQIVPL
jgi:hypothetical protein